MRMREFMAMLVVLLGVCQMASASVLQNGRFDKIVAGAPVGWSITGRPVFGSDTGGRFARLDSAGAGRLKQTIELQPQWREFELSARMRGKGLPAGDANWHNARIITVFENETGDRKWYNPAPHLSGDTDGWVTRRERFSVPAGATRLVLEIGNFGRAGQFDVSDVQLVPDPPLPHRTITAGTPVGSFEHAEAEGWEIAGREGISVQREGGNSFLRITNTDPQQTRSLEQRFKVEPDGLALKFSLRMRAPQLTIGKATWETARVQLQFVDERDQRVGGWPAVPELREPTPQWVSRSVTIDVPPGARYLKVSPGLYQATGTFDLDEIEIEPIKPVVLPDGLDLIAPDGGFERPEDQARWRYNNWAGNDVSYERVPDGVRSGGYSLRIDQRKSNKGADAQLYYPLEHLKGGERLRLTFWVRGPENTPPIEVALQQIERPWGKFAAQHVSLGEQWTKHSYIITVPRGPAVENLGLYFNLRGEHRLWLDDVQLVGLPAVAPGEPLVANQVVNGSFEVGRERWSFDEQGRSGLAGEIRKHEANLDFEPRIVPLADAPHGGQALHVEVREPTRLVITSAYFDLRYGHPAVLAFSLKTGEPGRKVTASVGSGAFGKTVLHSKTVSNAGTAWQEHLLQFRPEPSASERYFVEFVLEEPGDYWIDHVRVNEGLTPTTNPQRPNVGVIALERQPGNLYVSGDRVAVRVLAESGNPLPLRGRVIDVWGDRVGEPINLSPSSGQPALLELPADRLGALKLELTEAGAAEGANPAAEWQYMVLPKLPPPSASSDRFFGGHGGHGGMSPHHLAVAERVGLRWIRAHPPWNTKWAVVEPRQGEWNFPVEGMKRAADAGFELLGSYEWTPAWAADQPAGELHKSWRGSGHLPPRDWALWRRYVVEVTKAFAPYIDTWEVWNEPDLDSWLHPPFGNHGPTKAELYLRFVDETRRALDEAGLKVTLGAGALARADDPLMDQLLAAGMAQRVDAVSFHLYSLRPLEVVPLVRRLAGLKGRDGGPVEIWQSEGAFTLPSRSWLRTLRSHEALPDTVGALTAGFATQLAILKAAGVDRNFHYPAPNASAWGRIVYRNDFSYGDDVMGNPLPLWAAHAAAVKFLDEMPPAAEEPLRELAVDGKAVWLASFARDGRRVWVAWSASGDVVDAAKLPVPADAEAFDTMGNPLGAAGAARFDWRPIYLVDEGGK